MGTRVGFTGREMSEGAWSLSQDLSVKSRVLGEGRVGRGGQGDPNTEG